MARLSRNLVIGDTLTPASDEIVEIGAEIARQMDADLHLLHGFEMPPAYFLAPSAMDVAYAGLLEVEEQRRNQRLDEQLQRLRIGEPRSRAVRAGVAHRLINEFAEEIGADLIVIGSHDSGEIHGFGSVTDRVLRKAVCPVLVVRGAAVLRPARVLAPVDLSPLCAASMERALEIVAVLASGQRPTLTALFVLPPGAPDPDFTPEAAERRAHQELERWMGEFEVGGWRLEAKVRSGDPRHEILRQIEVEPPDLVIVGSHGRSGFERFLLGSVSEAVVRRAATSVLVAPPPAEAES